MSLSVPERSGTVSHVQSDPEKTEQRIRRLDQYVRQNLLDDRKFVCKHQGVCRASVCRASAPAFFYEGQMSHVGKHYDLIVDGHELRVVIVGQEYGQACRLVNLVARTAMIDTSGKKSFPKRNPHMAGTTSILRVLLGRQPGRDRNGERLFQNRAQSGHIFDGFALVNYLLCSALAVPPKGMNAGKGRSTGEMQRHCADHFLATLEILQPTVIVAEGQDVRSWIGGPLRLGEKPAGRYDGPATPEVVHLAGRPVDVLTFNHPSAPGHSEWWGRSPNSKYLKRVVEPTIVQWRQRFRADAKC